MLNLKPLNLQFFAEDTGTNGGTETPPAEPAQQQTEPPNNPQQVEEPKPQETNPAQPEPPKLDTEAIAKKAQAELLKQLGISDVKTAKADLKAYQDYKNSQKSEAEKQAEKIAEYEKSLSEKNAALVHASAKVSALSKGVKADSVDDVIKLVSGSEDVDKALDAILTKYPQFKQETVQQSEEKPENKKPSFGNQNYKSPEKPGKGQEWIEAFKNLVPNVTK